jgi:hypothetical protein
MGMSVVVKQNFSVMINPLQKKFEHYKIAKKDADSLMQLAEGMWPHVNEDELNLLIRNIMIIRGLINRHNRD